MDKKVSIVICTYNRAPFLDRTLHSLKNLSYKNFEVIVINGPSTDNTNDVLAKYEKAIKIGHNPEANLSISRNMGIKMSSGEIVAFIDDDAIPSKNWLGEILPLYATDDIGGAGGKVLHGEYAQFENGYLDIWGEVTDFAAEPQNFNDPNGDTFNRMMGTNSTFLKKALIDVGGFDEYYEYFHDETDLCVRIIKKGYKILHHPHAIVHHEFAKSHIRENTYNIYQYDWYPIVKSEIYYILKNSEGHATEDERKIKATEVVKKRHTRFIEWYRNNEISIEDFNKFIDMWNRGFEKGFSDALSQPRLLNYDLENNVEFMKYEPQRLEEALCICLLCRDDIFSGIGGTAKHTYELAQGFVKAGHQVHVITGSDEETSYMNEGISIHKIRYADNLNIDGMKNYPTTNRCVQYSYCIYKKILQLHEQYKINIIESPTWDFEGIIPAYLLKEKIPVVTRLQTPLLKAVESNKLELTEDLQIFSDFERALFTHSVGVIAISDNIKDTVEELYGVELKCVDTVYLGVEEPESMPIVNNDNNVKILFVGRLERRKGIHTLLEAVPGILENNSNIELILVGNDGLVDESLKDTFRDYFTKKYSKKSWFGQIKFLGEVSNVVKNREFASCDILVAPSLYESFGIILIEAMSYGKPVVGCNIGGMQEIVMDGDTGYLIKPEQKRELVDALNSLVKDKGKREQMGQSGYERYKEMFSNERMIEGTLRVYERYMAEKKPTSLY